MDPHHKRKQPPAKIESDGEGSPAAKVLEAEDHVLPVGIATDRGGKSNQEVRSYDPSALAAAAQRSQGRSFSMEDGSTCLVAMVRDGILHVGNVGDSRAVLSTRKGNAIAMSEDQKPNRKDERQRLEAKGAFITGKPDFMYRMWPLKKMLDVPRVNGSLAVSRSIGDLSLKPWISCDPEIKTHKITKGDQFLILASDGLWDVVTSKAAAQLASTFTDPQEVAEALVALALARHTFDNVTVVVINLESYARSTSRTDVLENSD
ncbi:hypothetical protein BBJ28_00002488 [Nothophytophthora sp. Chile5]|nr:hypothetical protein BBJ28_00002488 [Nothophytophthora sp. Chile5]